MALSKKRIAKVLISLRRCAGWSASLLFAHPEDMFSRVEDHLIFYCLNLDWRIYQYTKGTLNSWHVVCWLFSKWMFSKILQEYNQSVKLYTPRSGPTFFQAWSSSKLFANFIGRWQGVDAHFACPARFFFYHVHIVCMFLIWMDEIFKVFVGMCMMSAWCLPLYMQASRYECVFENYYFYFSSKMLWVLKRFFSMRRFFWAAKTFV